MKDKVVPIFRDFECDLIDVNTGKKVFRLPYIIMYLQKQNKQKT